MNDFKAYLAEAIATFTLVFVGAGSILADSFVNMGIVGIAFAHGLAIMVMVYAIGHISGGHINPAVTIGMWVTKQMEAVKAAGYIVSQLIGGVVGALTLSVVFASAPAALNLGTPALGAGLTFGGGVLVEAILTFLLVFVIFATAVDKRAPKGIYGLAIGFVITLDILVGGVLTGAAMNPARAFGPALISGAWANQFVYWIGPIVGGTTGALVYNNYFMKK